MKQEKRRIKPWARWTAAFLALAFVFTFGAQSWITVKISAEESNAAKTYLAQQTDYVNASRLERLRTKLQTLTQPDGLEDYYRLAETHIAAEEYTEALECIQRCLELYEPEYGTTLQAELLLKEGCLLTILDRADEAEEAMEQVVQLAPGLADAYLVLAQLHAGSGDTQALAADLESYLELQPAAADMRLLLAQLYLAQGQGDEAMKHAVWLQANGGAQNTDVAGLFTGLGLAKLQREDTAGALELFETALSLDDTVDSLSDGQPVANTRSDGVTYYETEYDDAARQHEQRNGAHVGKVRDGASIDPFTVPNFLGTGYEVVWNYNNTMTIGGTAVGLVYIPGLGYTVAPGQNLSGEAAGLYQALSGVYWMPDVEWTVESSVVVDGMCLSCKKPRTPCPPPAAGTWPATPSPACWR